MYYIYFISLLFLFIIHRTVRAFSPIECLQNLANHEYSTQFTGTGNVYCAYIKNNAIDGATFKIKNTKIEDWDITMGNWDYQNTIVDTKIPTVVADADGFKVLINEANVNVIVWVLNNGNVGEITNVELIKSMSSKRDANDCPAFESDELIWRDISWDSSVEKSFTSGIINLNNTLYLDTLALLFKKNNDNIDSHYFENDYNILFSIKSDTKEWSVYTGEYDSNSNEIKICTEWDFSEKNFDISSTEYKNVKLTKGNCKTKESENTNSNIIFYCIDDTDENESCKNNMIWFQNVKNSSSPQRIWINSLKVENCGNDDD